MAYTRRHIRDGLRQILIVLADSGGGIRENIDDSADKLRLASSFVTSGVLNKQKFKRSLKSLVDKGFVEVKNKKGGYVVTLTDSGQKRAARYKAEDITISIPDWWDRKWRMVMFDIPEQYKAERDLFKNRLTELGFVQLQNSVYVHPAESHNEIEYIRTAYGIRQFVKLILVDKIEGELALRKHFNL